MLNLGISIDNAMIQCPEGDTKDQIISSLNDILETLSTAVDNDEIAEGAAAGLLEDVLLNFGQRLSTTLRAA